MTRVNAGYDQQSVEMFSSAAGTFSTATTVTSTGITDSGGAFPTSGLGYIGRLLVVADPTTARVCEGVIQSNTATAIVTDGMFVPGTDTQIGSLPTTGSYYIVTRAGAPARYIALSNSAGTPAAGDTTLPGEIVPPGGGGLGRGRATVAHNVNATTTTLTLVSTLTGVDTPTTIQRAAVFASFVNGSGPMVYEDALSPSQPLNTVGDSLTTSFQVAMS